MDFARIREVLGPLIVQISGGTTHKTIPSKCEQLGLRPPPHEGSKADKMRLSFDAVTDDELPDVARRVLEHYPPASSTRNTIQDLLWADIVRPQISKRHRREVARALASCEFYLNREYFDRLLETLWVLDDNPWEFFLGRTDHSLRAKIERHVHRNPSDLSWEELFDLLGVFEATDHRVALFLEGLASSDVLPDESAQRRFVEAVNSVICASGIEMREIDSVEGYPVFRIVSSRVGVAGRPKNLIFASPVKPDLRFRDALNNDIEIVTNADRVLVYDRPVGPDGLRWRDLQSWWSETQGIEESEVAKRTLFRRLRSSLPADSPPQALLFDAFYRTFGTSIPELPALLPEVWLHWDPKTVKERGPEALTRFRMDFLLLLPNRHRVVIEVDGRQHYAREDGYAAPERYAAMTAADRDLRLAGYEVFRFGASELQCHKTSPTLVACFFRELFEFFQVRAAK